MKAPLPSNPIHPPALLSSLVLNTPTEETFGRIARESEQRFRQLFNQASDAVFVQDVEGRFIDVNELACTSLGYTREELLQMRVQDIELVTLPEEVYRNWREMPPGESATFHGKHRRKDGSVFPVEVRISALETAEGRRVLALARDITERWHQEELLRARVQQQQVIAQLGLQALREDALDGEDALNALFAETVTRVGETLQVNLSTVLEGLPTPGLFLWRAAYGWPKGIVGTTTAFGEGTASLVGYTLLTREPVVINDYAAETRFHVPAAILAQGVSSGMAVVIHTEGDLPFGTLSAHSCRPQQFTADDVSFLQAAANILAAAITRQTAKARVKRALEEAAAARQAAERANAAKSGFLSRMSHELRTPLNAILGFGQLLELDHLSALQEQSVGQILKAGHHLLGLVDEILDIARIESGQITLCPEPLELDKFLREILELVRPLAAQRSVKLSVLPPDASEPGKEKRRLVADPNRLKQILLNLLANAVKYNRQGGEAEVSCRWLPSLDQPADASSADAPSAANGGAGCRLRLMVRDTGPGIAAESIQKLFTPFERLEAAHGPVEGTGLGLVVCRQIVEAMGGAIGVESMLGVGSIFWVELPEDAAGKPSPETAGGNATDAEAEAASASVPVTRLLYIEDNASNVALVQTILTRQRPDWQISIAVEGSQGLKAAQEQPPHLILLDLQLPGMPGSAVLQQLLADPRTCGIPVIMLSADANPRSREALLAAGARDYLTKPLNVRGLLTALDDALAASQRKG